MHVDKYGLPTQDNGDANDQLARESMLLVGGFPASREAPKPLETNLQPHPGIYARYTGAPTYSTSADQIISALCYWVTQGNTKQIGLILGRCLLRLGFAQNYKDTLNGTDKVQIPDFMLLRALPLFARAHKVLWPFAVIADLLLVFAAIAAVGPVWKDGAGFAKRSPDDVDDNVIILTLIACSARMATPFSRLACALYAKWRPWNYGCIDVDKWDGTMSTQETIIDAYHPAIGALRWYHRTEAGGNPEVAHAIIPAVNKYILNKG